MTAGSSEVVAQAKLFGAWVRLLIARDSPASTTSNMPEMGLGELLRGACGDCQTTNECGFFLGYVAFSNTAVFCCSG